MEIIGFELDRMYACKRHLGSADSEKFGILNRGRRGCSEIIRAVAGGDTGLTSGCVPSRLLEGPRYHSWCGECVARSQCEGSKGYFKI